MFRLIIALLRTRSVLCVSHNDFRVMLELSCIVSGMFAEARLCDFCTLMHMRITSLLRQVPDISTSLVRYSIDLIDNVALDDSSQGVIPTYCLTMCLTKKNIIVIVQKYKSDDSSSYTR